MVLVLGYGPSPSSYLTLCIISLYKAIKIPLRGFYPNIDPFIFEKIDENVRLDIFKYLFKRSKEITLKTLIKKQCKLKRLKVDLGEMYIVTIEFLLTFLNPNIQIYIFYKEGYKDGMELIFHLCTEYTFYRLFYLKDNLSCPYNKDKTTK